MKQEDYKYEAHNFKKIKQVPWGVCVRCGLVTLNNKFTAWSVDKGCNSRYHPSYESARHRFTKLFD